LNSMQRYRRIAGIGVLALALLPVAAARAQAPPTVVSPEVTHTGTGPTGYTVTFRYYDPTATRMRVRGEWFFSGLSDTTTSTSAGRLPSAWLVGDFPIANPNNGAAANWPVADMTLDPATGIWSYTTPMASGTYTYGFYRNCTTAAPSLPTCTELSDPSNPPFNTVGGVTSGAVEPTSQVYVPSDPSFGTKNLAQEAPNAVHGTVTDLTYPDPESTSPAGQHYVAVYTPPGYDAHRALPYPTLYISHGAGGVEADWFTQGVANRIVDNLIAAGKMQQAVVVSTNFNGLPNGVVGYQTDVLTRVIPFVEANFNVSHNAADRGFAGLSAGAQRANQLIFNATTSFGYFGSWSIGTSGAPTAGSPLYNNPDLKTRLGLVIGGGRFDSITVSKATLEQRLTDAKVPFTDDTIDGGHEWYTWRQLLVDFGGTVVFRQTSTAVTATAGTTNSVTATVTPGTAEPVAPTGTVQFSAGGAPLGAPVPLVGGKATLAVPSTLGAAAVTATYSGDAFYNTSNGSVPFESTSPTGGVGGSVPATLSLTLGAPATFGAFTPGVTADYTASTTANVISTAGDATLSVADPSSTATGHLVNGAFSLPSPLQARARNAANSGTAYNNVGSSASPLNLLTYDGPVSNDAVTLQFSQHIGSTDALRTGTYSKTLTFTLSTTTP
jgi:enterochelin esterase-like enzyme